MRGTCEEKFGQFFLLKLYRVHCPILTSTHKWTLLFSHRETPWNTAWRQQNKDWPSFKVLRKFNSKFDCLVYEMLYMKDIKPSLNTQADSIHAKLFMWHFGAFSFFSNCVSYLGNYTHWTRKYFMYCFKFFIFVLHLILFHFSSW